MGVLKASYSNVGPRSFDLVGDLVSVDDGSDDGGLGTIDDGCEPIITDLTGKIALLQQTFSDCQANVQIEHAKAAGAIGAVYIND